MSNIHRAQCVHRLTVLSHFSTWFEFGHLYISDYLRVQAQISWCWRTDFQSSFSYMQVRFGGQIKGLRITDRILLGALGAGGERPMCFFAQHAAVHCSLVFAVGCSHLGPLGLCWFSLCACSPPPPNQNGPQYYHFSSNKNEVYEV